MNNQKGNSLIVVIGAVIILVLVAVVYFISQKSNLPSGVTREPNTQQTTNTTPQGQTNQAASVAASVPEVKNPQDLTSVSNDLDNTNIDSLNNDLNQNDADAQTFGPRIRLKNGTSLNWSGYAVETSLSSPQSNAVNDVKGSWVVPSLTCSGTNTYSSSWVGIDGYSDNSVEQTGTEHDCINGQPSYYAWYEMYPKPSFRVSLAVKTGDTMSAEVQYVSGKQFILTLTNTTTGQTFTTKQNSKALRQSAEWIMEAPSSGGVLPLANFGTMPFSNAQATLNTHAGTISDPAWQNDAITMTASSGTAKATPSSLTPDGSGFNVTWNSN